MKCRDILSWTTVSFKATAGEAKGRRPLHLCLFHVLLLTQLAQKWASSITVPPNRLSDVTYQMKFPLFISSINVNEKGLKCLANDPAGCFLSVQDILCAGTMPGLFIHQAWLTVIVNPIRSFQELAELMTQTLELIAESTTEF